MRTVIGRGAELERAVTDLADPDVDGVLVSGEAGIGKSRLLAVVEERLGHTDGHTARLPTSAATASLSMWPFHHLLPQVPPSDLLDLARHVRGHLVALSGAGRVTLFIDDVQHLDAASIGMLDHLLRGGHVRLAATIRTGEPHLDELDALWTRFDIRELQLEALTLEDCAILAEQFLDGPVATGSLTRLADIAQGNPLLLRELVLDATENGTLVAGDDGWTLRTGEKIAARAIGDRTRLCIRRRIARLGAAEQELLRLLAVAGAIPPEVVPDPLAEALVQLEARRLARVSADRPGVWRAQLDHPLLAEVLQGDMTGSERRAALSRLIDLTRRLGPDNPGAATRIASWAESNGDELTSVEWLRATAEAVAAFDHDAATRWARRGVATDPDSLDAHLALGTILRHQGHLDSALAAFAEAERCALSDEEIATAALEHATLLALALQRPHEAVEALRAVTDRITSEELTWALRSEAAVFATLVGEFDPALFDRPVDLDGAAAGPAIRWRTGLNELYSRTMIARVAAIDDLVASTLHCFSAVEAQRPQELDFVVGLRGAARLLRGEALQGRAELEPIVETRRSAGAYRGISAMILALIQGIACDPRAVATAIDGVEQHEWIDPLGSAPIALAIASLVAGATGDLDTAEAFAARGDTGSEPWRSIWIGRARAQIDHLRGDADGARRRCTDASRRALETSHVAYAAITAHGLVTYGDAPGAAGLLDEALARSEGCEFVGTMTRHAHAVAAGDAAALTTIAADFAIQGAPWSSASCHLQRAEIRLADGDATGARRDLTVGLLAFERLRPFVAARAPSVPDAPSAREREVAALAVQGLTSAQIAKTLERSVRTVDNHLHRLYRKLDLDGREHLLELAVPR